MGEKKIVLDFRSIHGKRVKDIEDLLNSFIEEAYNNPTLNSIRAQIEEKINEIAQNPEFREALAAYCRVGNIAADELKAGDDRFKKRIPIILKDYIR